VHAAEVASAGQSKEQRIAAGRKVYQSVCQACHGVEGKGLPGAFPPVANSDWIAENQDRLVEVILKGLSGPLVVNGQQYNAVMPPMAYLSDVDIANVLTFVLNTWDNPGGEVQAAEVAQQRNGAPVAATQPGDHPVPGESALKYEGAPLGMDPETARRLVDSEGPHRTADAVGRIVEQRRWTIEPFLDGDYPVPAFEIRAGDRLLTTAPMVVEVVSVLDPEDAGSFPAAAGAMLPDARPVSPASIILMCTVVALGSVALGWLLRRDRGERSEVRAVSDAELLRGVASGRIAGDAAMAALNGALNRLAEDRDRPLAGLLRRCERARFGSGGQVEDPRVIAQEALSVLGVTP
jgi:mono/diheme cytochrome c family protein